MASGSTDLRIDNKDGIGIELKLLFGKAQVSRKALVLVGVHHEEVQALVGGTSHSSDSTVGWISDGGGVQGTSAEDAALFLQDQTHCFNGFSLVLNLLNESGYARQGGAVVVFQGHFFHLFIQS